MEEEEYKSKIGQGGNMEMLERPKQEIIKNLTGDEATGGPSQTPEQLERSAWNERKLNAAPVNLSQTELERLLQERKLQELQHQKEQVETQEARAQVEKIYWDDIEKSCLDGYPEERFARALVRMSMRGVFGLNPMQDPRDKARVITEILRFHGIQIRDSKQKPSREDFEQTIYFVSDPFVRKGDIVLTRRAMFPPGATEVK